VKWGENCISRNSVDKIVVGGDPEGNRHRTVWLLLWLLLLLTEMLTTL